MEKRAYEPPQVEDFGEIHEVTQHHGKQSSPKDMPGGGAREHVRSGVIGG